MATLEDIQMLATVSRRLFLACAFMILAAPVFADGIDTPPGSTTLNIRVQGAPALVLSTPPGTPAGATPDVTAPGNITAQGTLNTGAFAVGSQCATIGTRGYDPNNDVPVYCNRNLVWAQEGGSLPPGTLCGLATYDGGYSNNGVGNYNPTIGCQGQDIGTVQGCPSGYQFVSEGGYLGTCFKQ